MEVPVRIFAKLVIGLILGSASALFAQYVNEDGDVKLLVPKPPVVEAPITKLLLACSWEPESLQALKGIQSELSRQSNFSVNFCSENGLLPSDVKTLDDLSAEIRARLAKDFDASHVMWIRIDRYDYKEKRSTEVINTKSGNVYVHKWHGIVSGILHCPVMDLATGKQTTIVPQNLQKQYHKVNELAQPVAENSSTARIDLAALAARKALQMVVPVHVIRILPFMDQGDLSRIHKLLKSGNLDEALGQVSAMAVAGGSESAKYQARVQYDLALLLCLKNRPQEALLALKKAEANGYYKSEIRDAIESCQKIIQSLTSRL